MGTPNELVVRSEFVVRNFPLYFESMMYRFLCLSVVCSITMPSITLPSIVIADDVITMRDMVVTVIDQVDVPARETGVLETLDVAEGDRVRRGQVIGQIDDRQIKLQASLANADLQVAQRRAQAGFASELAKQDLALAQQLADQQSIVNEVAEVKASSDVRVEAANKAAEMAKNEWARAKDSRARFVESVSKSELDHLRLAYERSELERQQAALDNRIDVLNVKSEAKESLLHELRIERTKISLQQATEDQAILKLQTQSKRLATELAEVAAQRHQIVSPIAGVVVQRYQRAGQWVQPGAAVLRVVRMNRLQAEGFLDIQTALKLRNAKNVSLRCATMNVDSIAAEVTFVSPEVDPVNGQVRVLVQFDNQDERVLPGMRVDLTATPAGDNSLQKSSSANGENDQ